MLFSYRVHLDMESSATSSSSSVEQLRDTDILLIVGIPLLFVAMLVGLAMYFYHREQKKRKLLLQLTRRDRALRRLSVNNGPTGKVIQKKLSSLSSEATSEV
jgi:hypothetical protein